MRTHRLTWLIVPALTALVLFAGCAHVPAKTAPAAGQTPSKPYYNIVSARYAENQGDWETALRQYASVDDPFSWLAQARIHFILNNNDSALRLLDALVETEDYADDALELRTEIYAKTNRWDLAIADAQELSDKYPDNNGIKLFLARLKLIVSSPAEAKEILEEILTESKDPNVLYLLSKACISLNDMECAKNSLERLIDSNPEFLPAYLDLGKINEIQGNRTEAEDIYLRLLDIDPYSLNGHRAIADLYIGTGRYDKALRHIKFIVRSNPEDEISGKLILLLLHQGLFPEALEMISILEVSDSTLFYRAFAYAGLEEWEMALSALEDLSETAREGMDVVLLQATIMERLDKKDEAMELLQSAWTSHRNNTSWRDVGFRLANMLDEKGRRAEGLEIGLFLLEENPDDPLALNYVGYLWADEGINLEQALTMIERALSYMPDDGFIMDSMGWVLFKLGRLDEALGYMNNALAMENRDPTINEHMGDILSEMGMKSQALDYYLKSLVTSGHQNNDLVEKINNLGL